jgi:hypothetical protein
VWFKRLQTLSSCVTDFHGDGSDGEIDAGFTAGDLLVDGVTISPKCLRYFGLALAKPTIL